MRRAAIDSRCGLASDQSRHQSDQAVDQLPQGRLLLHGDNPAESSDSRQFGALERRHLIGVVTSIVR